ncbi:hypothetical protein ACQKKX_03335 [Neorhizobium sp. NPDC001467]|uniref:hypothetical protein n=1 Tax=Neorhizobium sp. NPDC001467 TaxID=3390595 RepID=UPI003CFF7E8F
MRQAGAMRGLARSMPLRISPTAMTHRVKLAVLLALAFVLCACNTTDALTPQVDVGGGLKPSNPVTQAETERMASAHPQIRRQPGSLGLDERFPDPPLRNRRGPQNSLEAQARAIEAGNASPVASAPLPPLPGTASALQRSSKSETPAVSAAGSLARLPASPQQTGDTETIRFLPIIGGPVQAVTPLSRALGMRARAAGLTIKPSSDTAAQHILKGYLSAFADGDGITVVYVWDILDATGNRLNRIQGQHRQDGDGDDPWSSVPAATMEAIAGETIDAYMEWRQAQPG